MRRAFTAVATIGSAALILSGTAAAAPPIDFDQWTASNGQISTNAAECGDSIQCGQAMSADGFMQREITDSNGNQFFQTIITDQGATGDPSADDMSFSDESFVLSGGGSTGLADKQQVNDTANGFQTSVDILQGWANEGEDPLTVSQTLSEEATDFETTFTLSQAADNISRTIDMSQTVDLQTPAGDSQRFVLRQRGGGFADSADSPLTLTGATPSESLAFEDGDTIDVVWVGQSLATMGQDFGFESFNNRGPDSDGDGLPDGANIDANGDGTTENVETISFFSQSDSGPFDWNNDVFASTPSF